MKENKEMSGAKPARDQRQDIHSLSPWLFVAPALFTRRYCEQATW